MEVFSQMADSFDRFKRLIDEFIKNADIAKQNANFVRSIPVLEHILVSEICKEYLFSEICSTIPLSDLHREGWVYVHQTHKLSPYCLGLSSRDIAEWGLFSLATNERRSKPPKRLDTLFQQCANLICLVSQECSGAVSLNDISTVAAGYLYVIEEIEKTDKLSDYELKNIWQTFLYNINLPFRTGNSPFTNITLEFGQCDPRLANFPIVHAGKLYQQTYSQIPSEYFDRINMSFISSMIEGDAEGNPFTFPLITVNVYNDFKWDNPSWLYLVENSDKFGGFYVQNYRKIGFEKDTIWKKFNPYLKPFEVGMIYSNCCRMTFDLNLVEVITGSNPFHSGSGVGGIGVYAININRLLWLYKKDFERLKESLDYLIEVGQSFLNAKRNWIQKHYTDLYPYVAAYQKTTKTLYNIFSIVGGHEGLINAGFEEGIFDIEAIKYSHKILQFVLEKLDSIMKRDQVLVSLEFAPSESASPYLAKKDLQFKDKLLEFINKKDVRGIGDVTNIPFFRQSILQILKERGII